MLRKPLNILVIGTGMYVCGRGTDGYGTVLPAIFEWKKRNDIGDVCLVGTDPKGIAIARKKIRSLERDMNVKLSVRYFPEGPRAKNDCYRGVTRCMSKPSVSIIAVPDDMHSIMAKTTIKSGIHTLVVKPLAPTVEEVRELTRLQKSHDVYCAVEFHKRFDLANLKLRDAIRQKTIGEPLFFLVEYSQRKSVPLKRFKKWVSRTNIFQYLGIHYVDIIYFATGARPMRAMAVGQKGWLASKGVNTYDSIQTIVEWKMPSGKAFVSHILTNWIDPESTTAMSDQKIKVIGTKGRFESDQKRRGITLITDKNGVEEPNPYFCSPYGGRRSMAYEGYGIESIKQFLDDVVSVEERRTKISDLEDKRPTFKESLVPTMVLEAVNRSLKKNGAWIKIKSA